ncbi:MAG: hypothetical protein M1838_001875 [Thelocarpon superellum]|nr:MAG: hypothetical protein M1838_001875 [Thelocarpon superellum]
MADADGDWRPNNRPQSTIARSFSAALNDAFKIDVDADLGNLSNAVEQKKQAVSSQSQELEALEARLRATEERLRQKQTGLFSNSASSAPSASESGRATSQPPANAPPPPPVHTGDESYAAADSAGPPEPADLLNHSKSVDCPQAAPTRPSRQPLDVSTAMPGTFAATPQEEGDAEYVEVRRPHAQANPISAHTGADE